MIRKAQKRDLEAVNKLLLQVLMVHYEIRPDLYIPNTKKYTDDELLKIFECESTPFSYMTTAELRAMPFASF